MVVNKIPLYVFEVLDKVRKARSKEQKISILRENETWALKDVLGGIYDDSISWILPGGTPPFKESREESVPSNLLRRHKDFKYFFKGGPGEKLNTVKREALFIGLLEGIHPQDAELVIKMINKEKLDGITKNVVIEAFPSLPIK